ncbi:MAG TPA: helix-turn-helix domain-containing protein [Rhizomicrobium sp.]
MRPPVNSSTLHVLHTLRLVCTAEAPLSHAEISRRTDLPSTTVYRALSTLEEAQYVQRSQGTTGYEAGIMPQLLLWTLLKRFALAAAGTPFLTRLAELSGGTASLHMRLGWYALRISVVYGGDDIYHRDRLGEVVLPHADPGSRSLFAFQSDDAFGAYRKFVLRHHEDAAREIDRPQTRRDVETAREAGYAIAESSLDDLPAVFSIPLRDQTGRAMAAIALSVAAFDGAQSRGIPEPWRAVLTDFERLLAAQPALFASPYGHLAAEDIVIKLQKRPRGDARDR